MDKIILATTLAALMAANSLPALSRDPHIASRADKSNAERKPLVPARPGAPPSSSPVLTEQA